MKKMFLLSISALLVAIGSPVRSSDVDPRELKEVTDSFGRVARKRLGCRNLEMFRGKTDPLYSKEATLLKSSDLKFQEIEYGNGPRGILEDIKIGDNTEKFGRVDSLCLDNGHPWTATKRGSLLSFGGDYPVAFTPGIFLGMAKAPFMIEQDKQVATYSQKDDRVILDTLHLADLYQLHLTGGSVGQTVGDMNALWKKYSVFVPIPELYKSLTFFGDMLGFESKSSNNRLNGALATLRKIASVEQDRNDLITALLLSSPPSLSLALTDEAKEKANFFDHLWSLLLEKKVKDGIFVSSYNEVSHSGFVYDLVQKNREHYAGLQEVLAALLPDRTPHFSFTFFTERLGENSTFYQDKGMTFDFNSFFRVKNAPFAQYVELD